MEMHTAIGIIGGTHENFEVLCTKTLCMPKNPEL